MQDHDPSTQEMGSAEPGVQGYPQLHSKFVASLSYVRPYLRKDNLPLYFTFHGCACVYVYLHMCIHVCSCALICVCTGSHMPQCSRRGQERTSDVGPCLPSTLLKTRPLFLFFCFAHQAVWPRASGDSPVPYACNLRDCRRLLHGRLFMGSVVSNPGPHAYVANPFTH